MESINEQAARWAVRADRGAMEPEAERAFKEWLAADVRHRGAYVRARAQWADIDRLAAMRGPGSVSTDAAGGGEEEFGGTTVIVDARGGVTRRQMLAASIAAVCVGGAGPSWLALRGSAERYRSGVGEVRRIALDDGSTMLLNTDTEVTVALSTQRRDIHLVRGEAMFEVAHDKSRPFLVMADDTTVRAVGTAFAVRLEASQVDVTVTEGVVEVAKGAESSGSGATAADSDGGPKRVTANQRMVVASARAPEIRAIAPTDADRQLAWREGLVSFDGESLQAAVAEINRHNRRQIIVDDPQLAARPVVGVFRATDLDGFSAAAATALKARATSRGDVIRLEPLTVQTQK